MIEIWNNITTSEITFVIALLGIVKLVYSLVSANMTTVDTAYKMAMEWTKVHDELEEEKRYNKHMFQVITRYEKECGIPMEAISQMIVDDANAKL